MTISYGSYTSDGLRVGPNFSRQINTTPNTNANNTIYSGNNNLLAQGVLLAPWNTYIITPAQATTLVNQNVVALANGTTLGAGTLTLTGDNAVTTLQTNPAGVTASNPTGTICQFDWPRAVTLTSANNMSTVFVVIQGTDYYGLPLQQRIQGPGAGLTVQTTKSFYAVTSVYTTGAITAMSVGASQTRLGLPYRIGDASYANASYGGIAFSENSVIEFGTATLIGGTVPVSNILLPPGAIIQLGNVATSAGAEGAVYVSSRTNTTVFTPGSYNGTFTITSTSGTDTATIGYTIILPAVNAAFEVNSPLVLADPNIDPDTGMADNVNTDVRGLINLPWNADGQSVLTVYMYVRGADNWINQQADLNEPANPTPVNDYVALTLQDLIGVPQYYTGINA